jgi:hypothetical protein
VNDHVKRPGIVPGTAAFGMGTVPVSLPDDLLVYK